jgi:hypothetical protein
MEATIRYLGTVGPDKYDWPDGTSFAVGADGKVFGADGLFSALSAPEGPGCGCCASPSYGVFRCFSLELIDENDDR